MIFRFVSEKLLFALIFGLIYFVVVVKNFFFALIEEIFCWLPGKPFQLYFFVGENLLGVENSIWFGLAMNFLFCVWWVSALKPWKYIWRPFLKGSSHLRDKNSFESLQFLLTKRLLAALPSHNVLNVSLNKF